MSSHLIFRSLAALVVVATLAWRWSPWMRPGCRSRRAECLGARAGDPHTGPSAARDADQRRRVRCLLQEDLELGPLGRGRRARHAESDHRRQAEAGRVAGAQRPGRRPRAFAAHDARPRQRQPVRAHDEQRLLDRHLSRVVSRLRAQPHGRAVPHPLQGPDLQRLRARRRQHRDRAAPSSASRTSATATSRAASSWTSRGSRACRISSRARRSSSRISRRGRSAPASRWRPAMRC